MQNLVGLKDEMEMEVDDQLGYPRAYAKLCTNIDFQMPYSKGPPYTYLPYTLNTLNMEKVRELNQLFPVTSPVDTDPPNTEKYIDVIWKQLDHLGNAGFDPAKFRVDPYGNVLYFHADPASPLAWEVDHWFPRSRGGKTVPSNSRPVQWQVKQAKQNKLEFLVPWWDLQLGVSVNQFLSIFASKNADFRQRAFSSMFYSGKSEQLHEVMVVESHTWPQHFLRKKRQLGLAPAAIVRVQKDKDVDGILGILNTKESILNGTPASRGWKVEEDETYSIRIPKFRPSYSKENGEFENGFKVQKNDQYCLKGGVWEMKENMGDYYNSKNAFFRAKQKELDLKLKGEEVRKWQEISQLDQELNEMQRINEAERLALEDLEFVLIKQRRRTEKQRRLAETQASYKQCLEKMIRDTMHQNVVYKEQARLSQAACHALMARLESLKADSDMSERDVLKKFKQREEVKELLRPYSEQVRKRVREDDTASCSKIPVKKEVRKMRSSCPSAIPSTGSGDKGKESIPLLKHAGALEETSLLFKNMEKNSKRIQKELREFLEEDLEASRIEAQKQQQEEKRGVMTDGYESVGDNDKHDEIDEALDQVLSMQHQVVVARADAADEEDERVRQIGKANLDKWLQMLLQNTESGTLTDAGQGKPQLEIEEEEEGFDAFQTTPHRSTLIRGNTEQIRSPSTVAMKANAELRKTSDAQLHTDGIKTKMEMQRNAKQLLQSKGKEECRLKRNASARRPSSPSLWGARKTR
ncbi:hypothetical protein SUGI_0923400 [Cryptomeria japonica]|uniref:uncharacterized protein LOC131078736 n=1 Tax=Cryptomeria japonica TaxID=3369 RepID=UPI002414B510|nr:uncharacterized protein LOC131078736 [Cryptomeria japonica]GLJ44218.1 hypothetical protein SUGI_0923400 [Cryptomeria japonica]